MIPHKLLLAHIRLKHILLHHLFWGRKSHSILQTQLLWMWWMALFRLSSKSQVLNLILFQVLTLLVFFWNCQRNVKRLCTTARKQRGNNRAWAFVLRTRSNNGYKGSFRRVDFTLTDSRIHSRTHVEHRNSGQTYSKFRSFRNEFIYNTA